MNARDLFFELLRQLNETDLSQADNTFLFLRYLKAELPKDIYAEINPANFRIPPSLTNSEVFGGAVTFANFIMKVVLHAEKELGVDRSITSRYVREMSFKIDA